MNGFLGACLLLLAPPREETGQLLEQAFARYRAGEYAVARDLYREAIRSGADGGEIRYDLGNCEARTGNWAAALAQYRRAQAYLPRDADVRHNVDVARRKLGFATPPPGLTDTLEGLLSAFTRRELLGASLAAEALFFGLLALQCLRPSRAARGLSAGAGVGLFLCLGLLGHELFVRSARRRAVVLAETPARSEPRREREELFRLRPGEEVRILDSEGEWVRIEARGRGMGWLPSGTVESV
ncbi:MAG TPA: tetratricopeptide repeat protein [Planctomycetota bacterium]|nr:tetratricopeptide repeat protein [Planctomycetota bacterium]